MSYLVSKHLRILHIFLFLISNFILCFQKIYFAYFKFFYIHWDLFYGLGYCLSWNMSHVHMERICPLLFGVEYSITFNNLKLTVYVQNLNCWAENFSVIDDSVSPYVLAQAFFFWGYDSDLLGRNVLITYQPIAALLYL